ncbi:peroxiredoxin family protein [Flammeovirga kamogawensis]|uniref:TlpA family protein disulfide reductase n=1 Tax=Flammeovirga kamogawensis TaxID=373891 RepID=A0ABX8H1L1_9BACT|nr:TlpA disulfide reductase family protein [Flammeovirga kamogawensis]MBB6463669.1 peroxiredoxin [Flammeovirga kamogawensis]QWG09282.1 TlpA family protein disulfide reductase [Flammeovirga kamogawensis]TRX64806.1 TlpA family protein disulfide reductase [Flammeovirga kamogawensis]
MKNKKLIIIVSFLGVISFLTYSIIKTLKQKEEVENTIKKLPDFSFQSYLDTTEVITSEMYVNKKVIITFFNSTCHFCIDEIFLFQKNQQILEKEKIQVVLVSEEPVEVVLEFIEKSELDHLNFKFLRARENMFFQIFGSSSVPNSFLYNKEGKLIKNIKGLSKFTMITKSFEDDEGKI